MCTVTYIPQGENHFVLTSNRDEQPSRSPKNISHINRDGQHILFPKDKMAGGTWIAASSHNKVICLLNGAFEKHDRTPPYKRSRGLMMLDFFSYQHAEWFLDEYDFPGMEAFTMIIWDDGNLLEARWDEQQLHIAELDPAHPRIWSSSTLYDPGAKAKRQRWFADWLLRAAPRDKEAILEFHTSAGDGDPWNDVIMNRNDLVQTVSITCIEKNPTFTNVTYRDLLSEQVGQAKIDLKRELVSESKI